MTQIVISFFRSPVIKKMLKYAWVNCNEMLWDGKLIAILFRNRFAGYQAVNELGLSTSDCLCYRFFPSIREIRSHFKKILELSLFALLRNVFFVTIGHNLWVISSTLTALTFLHYWVATKMALEILGYTMCRVRLW